MSVRLVLASSFLLLAACGSAVETTAASSDALEDSASAITAREAAAVLAFANDRDVDANAYVFGARVARASAEALIAVRNGVNGRNESRFDGEDWTLGGDDEAFARLAELDALPGTDAGFFTRMRDYALAHGYGAAKKSDVLINAGTYHACAVHRDGRLSCWGGYSSIAHPALPAPGTDVPAGSFLFTQPAVGQAHSCAIRSDGTIACWGTIAGSETPTVAPPVGTFQRISAGMSNDTCAIRDDGEVVCWGMTPELAGVPSGPFKDVWVGQWNACAVRTSGEVRCWGANDGGEPASLERFDQVATGFSGRCGIKQDGSLSCWKLWHEATNVPSGSFSWVGTAGAGFVCALRTDKTVACWGGGAGNPVVANVPAGQFRQLVTSYTSACAVRESDDAIVCWGDAVLPTP